MYIWKFTLVVVFFICSLICGTILNLNSNHKMSKTATCVPSSLMEITAGRELLQAFKKLISFRKRAVFFSVEFAWLFPALLFCPSHLPYLVCWEIFWAWHRCGALVWLQTPKKEEIFWPCQNLFHFIAFLKLNMLIFFSGKNRLAQRSQERLDLPRK